jgi:hypothetical protein
MTQYDLLANVFSYPMPVARSNIIDVLVNGCELPYFGVKRQAKDPFYYITDRDELGIFPTPEEDVADGLIIFHYREPFKLSEANMSLQPELDGDYHMLLVYGALAQIAEGFDDINMVNNFTAKYNGLLDEFRKVNNETPDYPVIEDIMGVRL